MALAGGRDVLFGRPAAKLTPHERAFVTGILGRAGVASGSHPGGAGAVVVVVMVPAVVTSPGLRP